MAETAAFYYLRNYDQYSSIMGKHVRLMQWHRDKFVEEYTDYINMIYSDADLPAEIYFIASNNSPGDDMSAILNILTEFNYSREELFTHSDGILIRLSRT